MAENTGGGKVRKFIGGIQDKFQGNSTFYPVNLVHQNSEASVYCGWLKRQGGAFKSWHRKWFNLKNDHMHYFSAQDEVKLQGSIWLPGNDVIEHSMNPSKPDEFVFEVKTSDASSGNTESHLLCASSDDERKAWVGVIKQVMYGHKGGAIFGSNLAVTLQNEVKLRGAHKIPEVVEMCANFVIENGLDTEGIFRLPGRASLIRELKERFDRGERPTLTSDEHDVPTIASLLKQYLRDLPEPLIPKNCYEDVMNLVTRVIPERPDKGAELMRDAICCIPVDNYNLLQYLCSFLNKVASHSETNKMTHMNLATVFVHSIIRPEDEDPALLMGTANRRTQCLFFLMVRYHEIFTQTYEAQEVTPVENLLQIQPDTSRDDDAVAADSSESLTADTSANTSQHNAAVGAAVATSSAPSADVLLDYHDDHFAPTLPSPLQPQVVERQGALIRRGSRKAHVFNNDMTYGDAPASDLETDVIVDDADDVNNNFGSSPPLDDPGYETIESVRSTPASDARMRGDNRTHSTDSHQYDANETPAAVDVNQDDVTNSHVAGYSHIMNYSSSTHRPALPRERIDSDDYSYLPRESILRKKPPPPPLPPANDVMTNERDSLNSKRPTSPTVTPRAPPRPKPRSSLKKSRSTSRSTSSSEDNLDSQVIYSIPYDSVSESEHQHELRERSSRLLTLDLDSLSSRQHLVDYIEELKRIVASQTKELARVNMTLHVKGKEFERKLQDKEELVAQKEELLKQTEEELLQTTNQLRAEQDARTDAVDKVVYLQGELQRHVIKHGSTISESG